MKRSVRVAVVIVAGLALVATVVAVWGPAPAARSLDREPPLPEAEAKVSLVNTAQRAADAFNTADDAGLIALTHPALIRGMGGPDAMAERLAKMRREQTAEGGKMTTRAGDPGPLVSAGGRLYCVVSQPILYRSADGKVVASLGHSLGVSDDGGRTWKLVSAGNSGAGRDVLMRLFPDLPDEIVIPKQADPQLLWEP
jgi:hypothetical protein